MAEEAVCSKSAMSRTDISLGQAHELMQKLVKASFDPIWAQRIITNYDYAQRIVSFIKAGGWQETISQQKARQIMGVRFFGVEELAEHLGIILETSELEKIGKIPFEEDRLESCKGTHMLFLGINHSPQGHWLTINKLREMFPRGGKPQFSLYIGDRGDWFNNLDFAFSATPQLRWYLLRTSILEESRFRQFDEQMKLLKENEYLESAVVYVFAQILFYQAYRTLIFKNGATRCDDIRDERHNHVSIGSNLDAFQHLTDDIAICYCYDSEGGSDLGIAPAIKPEI